MNKIVEAVLNALPAEVARYAEEVAGLTKREHLNEMLQCDDNDDPMEPYDLIVEAINDGRFDLEVLRYQVWDQVRNQVRDQL